MSSDLDRALRRYQFLRRIASERADRAANGEPWEFYYEIGVIGREEKTARARKQLQSFHDELSKAIDQLGFLGVVAAFEAEMEARIKNAIGAARNAVRAGYPPGDALAKQAEGLVRQTASFESLSAIEELISGHLPHAMRTALKTIRGERNRLAHGTSEQTVAVTPDEAHGVLNEILDDTGPVTGG